jgi:ribbon-helix-helix protein
MTQCFENSESTDKALRTYLTGTGMKKGATSDFVDEAVQLHLFDLVTDKVKERNEQHDQADILSMIGMALT